MALSMHGNKCMWQLYRYTDTEMIKGFSKTCRQLILQEKLQFQVVYKRTLEPYYHFMSAGATEKPRSMQILVEGLVELVCDVSFNNCSCAFTGGGVGEH